MLSSFDDRRVNDEGRLLALRVGFVVCVCALAVGFWVFQVAQHHKLLGTAVTRVGNAGLQGMEVAVDVRQQGDFHCLSRVG